MCVCVIMHVCIMNVHACLDGKLTWLTVVEHNVQIVFAATKRGSWTSDIALDDVKVFNCSKSKVFYKGFYCNILYFLLRHRNPII